MLSLTQDPMLKVQDTASWALGKMCETTPQAVLEPAALSQTVCWTTSYYMCVRCLLRKRKTYVLDREIGIVLKFRRNARLGCCSVFVYDNGVVRVAKCIWMEGDADVISHCIEIMKKLPFICMCV